MYNMEKHSSAHAFLCSFTQQLLKSSPVPGCVLMAKETIMNKVEVLRIYGTQHSMGETGDNNNKKTKSAILKSENCYEWDKHSVVRESIIADGTTLVEELEKIPVKFM